MNTLFVTMPPLQPKGVEKLIVSSTSSVELTHEKIQQIGDGQTEQVVIGGRVHGGVTHNHDTDDDIANDAGQEDDYVDNGYLERIETRTRRRKLRVVRN